MGVWGVGGDPQAWAGWEAWHGLNRADERVNEPRTNRRSNLPKTPAIAGRGHDWKLTSYAHLFWLIPRDDSEEKWNCEVFNIDVTQAHALQHRGSSGTARAIARAFSVAVPALRNTRAIAKGEKVVLKWPKPKKVAKSNAGTTWMSKAKLVETKRQKLNHPSEQVAPSQ